MLDYPPPIVNMVSKLRDIIISSIENAEERVYPGWRAIGYRHPVAGYVTGIFPFQDHIKLIFEWGAALDDPDELLQGDTRQIKHILISSPRDIRVTTIRTFLKQAVELQSRRKRKR